MGFGTIEQAIEDVRRGKLVLVADDEDRESEGDLIGAAERVTPAMVNFMADRAEREDWSNVKVRTVQPDDPGLKGSTVDRILIVNTWHHISNRESYSRKLRDALKPGGGVLIVDFTQQSSHGPPVSQRIRPEGVVAELRAGGLDVEILQESLPDQYIVVGRRQQD